MPKDTDTIDSLFLELSQFTQATTAKELALQKELDAVLVKCAELQAWTDGRCDELAANRTKEYCVANAALEAKCEKLTKACAAALQWFETGPADFTRAAEVIVPELEAALSSS